MSEWYEEFVFKITKIESDGDDGARITLEESTSGDEIEAICATPEQARINQTFVLQPEKNP